MKKIILLMLILCPFAIYSETSLEEGSKFFQMFGKMIVSLAILLGLLFLVLLIFKRFLYTQAQKANDSSLIKIIEQRPLSQKATLHLLEIKGKKVLIAETAAGVTLLSHFPIEQIEQEP